MSLETAASATDIALLTVTWRGDLSAFRLLRASLRRSAWAGLEHHVVVHSEDVPAFAALEDTGMQLHSTAAVLPADLDQKRAHALQQQQRYGRNGTRWATSTARIGWPQWVRYMGWQMQQISKLAWTLQSSATTVIVLDADVLLSPQADWRALHQPQRPVCFTRPVAASALRGKTRNWNRSAQRLWGIPPAQMQPDAYFDTPFVWHVPRVRAMLQALEQRQQRPWPAALLRQDPRRWSEFATYRSYLREQHAQDTTWVKPEMSRYFYDASDTARLAEQVAAALRDPQCHFITVHSQSSGREQWSADDYAPVLARLL